jgi:hypothetical protein
MMKSDLTKALSQPFQEGGELSQRFEGEIEPDAHVDFFRLYPTPKSRSTYLRIPKSAEQGIYEWSADEILHSGLHGQRRFRVDIVHGAIIQRIDVQTVIVGAKPREANSCSAYSCFHDNGAFCPSGCGCTEPHGPGDCVPV